MDEPSSDALKKELDRLWQRVTSGGSDSEPPAPPISAASEFSFHDASSITREASKEAIFLIKRQQKAESARLKQLLELKERSLEELKSRLSASESEAAGLRARSKRSDEELYGEVSRVSEELEAAQKALQEQAERHAEEQKVLRSIADNLRRQLASETARWREGEHQSGEREQQFLLQIREMETRSERLRQESFKSENAARSAREELKEAKTAIERTLAELLKERQEREGADKERDRALGRVKEVEEHVQGLQNLWQEERAQWQELWDRERSTWDAQRKQFAAWEEKIQKQREDFHQNLEQLEAKETRYADQMSDVLRRSADAAEKVNSLLRDAARKTKEAVGADGFSLAVPSVSSRGFKAVLGAAVAVLILAVSIPPLLKQWKKTDVVLLASYALDADNPTGLAYDGETAWISQWDGRLRALDPRSPSSPLRSVIVKAQQPYHPAGVVVWGEKLYTLDTGQSRLYRHPVSAPESVETSWPAPGPAPTVFGTDGRNLWSYDAATRQLYRHLGEGEDSQAEAYPLPHDLAPGAIAWNGSDLWVYDAKAQRLVIFTLKGKAFELKKTLEFETPLQGMQILKRLDEKGNQALELWGLSVRSTGAASFKTFRIKNP